MDVHKGIDGERFAHFVKSVQGLIGVGEPQALLKMILEAAIKLFAADACSIALIDEGNEHLRFQCTLGGANVEEFQLPLGQGIIGWVAQTGQGVVSNDVSQDTRFFGTIDRQTGFRTKAVLCAPLQDDNGCIGAIEVLNTTNSGGFRDNDLQFLGAFGRLAASIIRDTSVAAAVRNVKTALQEAVQNRYQLVGGTSARMQEVLQLARNVANAQTTVLLLGESGTGKEVVARAIHQWSSRAEQAFVAVNCAALTPELLESELFGHEKGAFTGAVAQKKGRFELADRGTLFLDEIADLPLPLQAKLLRVLQEREFQRVGGVKDIHTDVRIIAATNTDLRHAIRAKAFRQDLYYRLNVVALSLPPLRDRAEDLSGLIAHFLERYCHELKRDLLQIDPNAMAVLLAHSWPGNVRELQNVIERAVVLCTGPTIRETDLPAELRSHSWSAEDASGESLVVDPSLSLTQAVEVFKRARIQAVLETVSGNQTQAAQLLGLPRSNLSRLMKRLGLRE